MNGNKKIMVVDDHEEVITIVKTARRVFLIH
jgi:hypothetical protein